MVFRLAHFTRGLGLRLHTDEEPHASPVIRFFFSLSPAGILKLQTQLLVGDGGKCVGMAVAT